MDYSGIKVNYLNLPAEPKRDMILARLGYRKSTTILEDKDKKFLETGIAQGLLLCNPKGAFARLELKETRKDFVRAEYDISFKSSQLSDLLSKSDEIVLMASTVGIEIVERTSDEIKNGNAALGLILDSVASQTADAGLDWLMSFLNRLLLKEGRKLTKFRFSPGYGELSLSSQKVLYDALKLQNLGLKITDTFMLVPEKSVLAIAGVERIEIDG